MKNTHLRRYPHPFPCQARGRLIAAYLNLRLTPQDFGCPREWDFEKLNLHLGIFAQSSKIILSNLLNWY